MHVGRREYVPVVSTSIASGIWKFCSRAFTSMSRDMRDNASAVSTNSIDCLSRNVIMSQVFSTLADDPAHFTSASSRMNSCLVRAVKL